MIWRWAPAIGLALFLVAGLLLRAWLHRRRTGRWGVILFRDARLAQKLRDGSIFVIFLALAAHAALVAAGVRPPLALPLAEPAWRIAGAAVMLASSALLMLAQTHLGLSWRVGIEQDARPGLVTTGLYRCSRNPIFVALVGALLGFCLLVPTWLTAAAFLAAAILVRQQTLEEEAYLLRTYGEEYRAYAVRVGRYLPWLGRL